MRLAEFQENMQQAILAGDTGIMAGLGETPGFARSARLGVYVDAYRLRLAGFVSTDYPVLREAISDEAFKALVIAYIDQTQSRHCNARWYASNLPEFMAEHSRWRRRERWIDLARLERALADAFDAADAPQLDADILSTIDPEKVPGLRFEFHSSVGLLELSKGVADAYAAAAEGGRSRATSKGREHVLIWRRNERCRYRALEDDEKLALDEALDGRSFGDICGLLAFQNSEDVVQRAANFLQQWFSDGLMSAVAVGE